MPFWRAPRLICSGASGISYSSITISTAAGPSWRGYSNGFAAKDMLSTCVGVSYRRGDRDRVTATSALVPGQCERRLPLTHRMPRNPAYILYREAHTAQLYA